MLASISSLH